MSDISVFNDAEQQRYAANVDGELAGFATYRVTPGEGEADIVVIPHTEVDDKFGGQGVGAAIVKFALDDIRAQGNLVVPQCPFVAAWINRHPDYADLVAPPAP